MVDVWIFSFRLLHAKSDDIFHTIAKREEKEEEVKENRESRVRGAVCEGLCFLFVHTINHIQDDGENSEQNVYFSFLFHAAIEIRSMLGKAMRDANSFRDLIHPTCKQVITRRKRN